MLLLLTRVLIGGTFLLFETGLEINPNRPNDKLPYGGVWLNVGSPSQMIHLMELPNPDPKEGRPKHGGRDRHACVSVKDVMKIKEVFDRAGMLKPDLYLFLYCTTAAFLFFVLRHRSIIKKFTNKVQVHTSV